MRSGKKTIFHGRIGLYNVPSFSHPPDVANGAMLMFRLQKVSRFKNDHMTSVLKGSANLCGIQSLLEVGFIINNFCCRVIGQSGMDTMTLLHNAVSVAPRWLKFNITIYKIAAV